MDSYTSDTYLDLVIYYYGSEGRFHVQNFVNRYIGFCFGSSVC
jgi:hypothetical protein